VNRFPLTSQQNYHLEKAASCTTTWQHSRFESSSPIIWIITYLCLTVPKASNDLRYDSNTFHSRYSAITHRHALRYQQKTKHRQPADRHPAKISPQRPSQIGPSQTNTNVTAIVYPSLESTCLHRTLQVMVSTMQYSLTSYDRYEPNSLSLRKLHHRQHGLPNICRGNLLANHIMYGASVLTSSMATCSGQDMKTPISCPAYPCVTSRTRVHYLIPHVHDLQAT
jgi:hypothetical protein